MGYAEVNGLRMYYEEHGAGDPLVLLHGALSAPETSSVRSCRSWSACRPAPTSSRR